MPPRWRANFRTALRLGRVSNLPTVWTNVMAGMALNVKSEVLPRSGSDHGIAIGDRTAIIVCLGVALSLFYVAGMYLNDAFDRKWDAQHRPERPIPAGHAQAFTVFVAGFALMAVGFLILILGLPTRAPLLGAGALATLIVIYDVSHKTNPIAPLVMGLCRVAVYITAALAVSPKLGGGVFAGAAVLLTYLVGLTLVAKQETKHPRLARAVGPLIAGICLLDGLMLLATGHPLPALACIPAFLLTRRLQRRIPGS